MKNFVYTVLLLFAMSACRDGSAKTEAAPLADTTSMAGNSVQFTDAQIKNSGIETGVPGERNMHSTIAVNGVLDVPPQNIVSVSMPLGGYVKSITLIPGSKVSRGTVLARIEDQQFIQLQQDYLTAKSRLRFLDADFNRQKDLNENKAVSDKIFQQARTDYEAHKILVGSLSEKLKLIGMEPARLNESNISRSVNLRSPINGFVTKVNVNPGKYVTPSDVLFEVINTEDLHVKLTVFENDAASFRRGQKIRFKTNDQSGREFQGTVILITPNIETDRSTEVHCHIDGNTSDLIAGTSVNALVEVKDKKVLAVPEDAVVTWENKPFVFLADASNKFSLMPVQTGVSGDGFIELIGFPANRKIVLHKAYTVLMKLKNAGEEE